MYLQQSFPSSRGALADVRRDNIQIHGQQARKTPTTTEMEQPEPGLSKRRSLRLNPLLLLRRPRPAAGPLHRKGKVKGPPQEPRKQAGEARREDAANTSAALAPIDTVGGSGASPGPPYPKSNPPSNGSNGVMEAASTENASIDVGPTSLVPSPAAECQSTTGTFHLGGAPLMLGFEYPGTLLEKILEVDESAPEGGGFSGTACGSSKRGKGSSTRADDIIVRYGGTEAERSRTSAESRTNQQGASAIKKPVLDSAADPPKLQLNGGHQDRTKFDASTQSGNQPSKPAPALLASLLEGLHSILQHFLGATSAAPIALGVMLLVSCDALPVVPAVLVGAAMLTALAASQAAKVLAMGVHPLQGSTVMEMLSSLASSLPQKRSDACQGDSVPQEDPASLPGTVKSEAAQGPSSGLSSSVESFCLALGGKRPIKRVLVANNGLAAVKFISSVRTWSEEAFGTNRAVELVGMASANDIEASAEHIRMVDHFVAVPGGSNNHNYANVELIVETARQVGADAVWPGWGHASEYPELPEALEASGLAFLGPPAAPMAALGDKIGSSILAQAAGVPTLPWSGSQVQYPLELCKDPIPEHIYRQACVPSVEEAVAACERVGYPAMVKASWGGGGKGIRKVLSQEDVRRCFPQIQGEVPGSPIFVMKLATKSRHLEVQLICDQYSNVVALHSRDCSIQRRHQKIIEEGPVTIAPPEVLTRLERGAREMARCLGYVGAATVEYLYSMETREFFFLELNPRLQVEHPVTEWITSVNLPATQLCIAMGIPLWRMPEIRRLFHAPFGGSFGSWKEQARAAQSNPAAVAPIHFDSARPSPPQGHVVAVRITSENSEEGFKPTTGKIKELCFKTRTDSWAYFSVKSHSAIHEYSDSQFGHVFARGLTRDAAITNMAVSLSNLQVHGDISTITNYCSDMLKDPDYVSNAFHTAWLDMRIARKLRAQSLHWSSFVIPAACWVMAQRARKNLDEMRAHLAAGRTLPKGFHSRSRSLSLNLDGTRYEVQVQREGSESLKLETNGSHAHASFHFLGDGGLLVQSLGQTHQVHGSEESVGVRLNINGREVLLKKEHDPSQLVAPTPCKLLRFLVDEGDHVAVDQPYAEVEVMKMCMPLLAPAAGTISPVAGYGTALQAGSLIATLSLDDPSSALVAATPNPHRFPPPQGSLSTLPCPAPSCQPSSPPRPSKLLARSLEAAEVLLAGHSVDPAVVVSHLQCSLSDARLPAEQWRDAFAVHKNKLPHLARQQVEGILSSFPEDCFPLGPLQAVLELLLSESPDSSPTPSALALESVLAEHSGGLQAYRNAVVRRLLLKYLEVEEAFNEKAEEEAVEHMRGRECAGVEAVVAVLVSHAAADNKSSFIAMLLDAFIKTADSEFFVDELERLAGLGAPENRVVSELSHSLLDSLGKQHTQRELVHSLSCLRDPECFSGELSPAESLPWPQSSAGNTSPEGEAALERARSGPLAELRELSWDSVETIDLSHPVEDILPALMDTAGPELRGRALEAYVRRLYRPFLGAQSISLLQTGSSLLATWPLWETADPATALPSPNSPCQLLLTGTPGTLRWGAMAVCMDSNDIPLAVSAALSAAKAAYATTGLNTGHTDLSPSSCFGLRPGWGNALHIVLLREALPEDGSANLGSILGPELASQLHGDLGVKQVSVLCPSPQESPSSSPHSACRSWEWKEEEAGFVWEPVAGEMEPPVADLLELDKVRTAFPHVKYSTSGFGHWHKLTALEKTAGIESPGVGSQKVTRQFLHTLVQSPFLPVPPPSSPGSLSFSRSVSFGNPLGGASPSFLSISPEEAHAAPSLRRSLSFGPASVRAVRRKLPRMQMAPHSTTSPVLSGPLSRASSVPDFTPSSDSADAQLGSSAQGAQGDLSPRGEAGHWGTQGTAWTPQLSSRNGGQLAARNGFLPWTLLELQDALLASLVTAAKVLEQSQAQQSSHTRSATSTQLFLHVLHPLHLHPGEGAPSAPPAALGLDYRGPTTTGEWAFTPQRVLHLLDSVAQRLDAGVGQELAGAGVQDWEMRVVVAGGEVGVGRGAWRVLCHNPTGHSPGIKVFRESRPHGREPILPLSPVAVPPARLSGAGQVVIPVCSSLGFPVSTLDAISRRRLKARQFGTTFCLDFPHLLGAAVKQLWSSSPDAPSSAQDALLSASHFRLLPLPPSHPSWSAVLSDSSLPSSLVVEEPLPSSDPQAQDAALRGSPPTGMLAWRLALSTPECPAGRPLLLLANDVTVSSGAFSPREDLLFQQVTNLAVAEGVPLLYLAANSGARIGVAEEVWRCLHVAWEEEGVPESGVKFLFLTPDDFHRLEDQVEAVPEAGPAGETRWRLTDIFGAEDGIGVECLSGSAAIASAFSRAYHEGIFTLTVVSGRTVGIGAYLARLGIRCIQRVDSPIILTGYSALNKLLGREVYTSHLQLGGPKVMASNGVVHQTVSSDFQGILAALTWLSLVPPRKGSPLPLLPSSLLLDPPSRPVEYAPEVSCNPRHAIQGVLGGEGSTWRGGIFDRGSFVEVWQGWARTVVTGRARLGGIPLGVIAAETASVELAVPPDPARPETPGRSVVQAGQVWYPDSAAKTALAIRDFNHEGLPLFILANWRGFSGGQGDLFEGILQAGSLIVDELRRYQQPAFVYIPPTGELRGGAWVVLDSHINPRHLEMYADPGAEGGILEPEGVVEIKFRDKDFAALAQRGNGSLCEAEDPHVLTKCRPYFQQAAKRFVKLHDTPRRMQSVGSIDGIVPWKDSRFFFHQRLAELLFGKIQFSTETSTVL